LFLNSLIAYKHPQIDKNVIDVQWGVRIQNYSTNEIIQSEIYQFFRFYLEKLCVSEDMSRKRNILKVIFRAGFF
jgi:predicted N-acyltransferase